MWTEPSSRYGLMMIQELRHGTSKCWSIETYDLMDFLDDRSSYKIIGDAFTTWEHL